MVFQINHNLRFISCDTFMLDDYNYKKQLSSRLTGKAYLPEID